jgi:hypothetical protein
MDMSNKNKVVVEFSNEERTTWVFETSEEAREFGEAISIKLGVTYQVYPEEPVDAPPTTHTPASQSSSEPVPSKPFSASPSMCELCGERLAIDDDFLCMECISRELLEME